MKINLIAVGARMPEWVDTGTNEYCRRMPRDFKLNIIEIQMPARVKNGTVDKAVAKEGEAILSAIDKKDYVVALAVAGKSMSTEMLAENITRIRAMGVNMAMMVGGPDGLSEKCLARADEKWSLSALTLPHPLVRIVLAEQMYRVWSFLNNHPYHRA